MPTGYCSAHNTQLPAATRFGSPQQAREAATGVQRKYPRLREQVEKKIEERAEEIVQAQIDAALKATRVTVGEDGEVHVHPDYLTRARSANMLLDRALGKPATEGEADARTPQLNLLMLVTNDDLRAKAADLGRAIDARRADAARRIEPAGLDAAS